MDHLLVVQPTIFARVEILHEIQFQCLSEKKKKKKKKRKEKKKKKIWLLFPNSKNGGFYPKKTFF